MDYCQGLMLAIKRKSVEPLAAHMDPTHVQARHQSLHHFVATSPWSEVAVPKKVWAILEPVLGVESGCCRIIDDTGSSKQGRHSLGVARQYCGQLGKRKSCQVAVSLSLASEMGSLPIKWQLYLPKEWTDDSERCEAAGVPDEIGFATKSEIALVQMRQAYEEGVPPGVVLADPAYGTETVFRDGITKLGLPYMVGIRSMTSIWTPGVAPLPPKPPTIH